MQARLVFLVTCVPYCSAPCAGSCQPPLSRSSCTSRQCSSCWHCKPPSPPLPPPPEPPPEQSPALPPHAPMKLRLSLRNHSRRHHLQPPLAPAEVKLVLWITHTQGAMQLGFFNGLVLALRVQRLLRDVHRVSPARITLSLQVYCNHFHDSAQRVTCESTELFSDESWRYPSMSSSLVLATRLLSDRAHARLAVETVRCAALPVCSCAKAIPAPPS